MTFGLPSHVNANVELATKKMLSLFKIIVSYFTDKWLKLKKSALSDAEMGSHLVLDLSNNPAGTTDASENSDLLKIQVCLNVARGKTTQILSGLYLGWFLAPMPALCFVIDRHSDFSNF